MVGAAHCMLVPSRQGVSFDPANNLLIEPARIEEEEVCTRSLLVLRVLGCGLSRLLPLPRTPVRAAAPLLGWGLGAL